MKRKLKTNKESKKQKYDNHPHQILCNTFTNQHVISYLKYFLLNLLNQFTTPQSNDLDDNIYFLSRLIINILNMNNVHFQKVFIYNPLSLEMLEPIMHQISPDNKCLHLFFSKQMFESFIIKYTPSIPVYLSYPIFNVKARSYTNDEYNNIDNRVWKYIIVASHAAEHILQTYYEPCNKDFHKINKPYLTIEGLFKIYSKTKSQ